MDGSHFVKRFRTSFSGFNGLPVCRHLTSQVWISRHITSNNIWRPPNDTYLRVIDGPQFINHLRHLQVNSKMVMDIPLVPSPVTVII